jgi:hypothetical protein
MKPVAFVMAGLNILAWGGLVFGFFAIAGGIKASAGLAS